MSEERGEKLAGEQGTVRGTAYQQEMQRRLARLNLGSRAFTDVMGAATTECRLFEGERARLLESERAAHAGPEKAQREARATLENISDAFVVLDRKRRFVYVNRLTGRFWGKPQKELLGKNVWEVFLQAVGTESYQAIERAAKEELSTELETAFLLLPGSWVAGRVYPSAEGL